MLRHLTRLVAVWQRRLGFSGRFPPSRWQENTITTDTNPLHHAGPALTQADPHPPPTVPPEPLTYPDRKALLNAAGRAPRVYPGPVGDLLARELLAWHEHGFRYGSAGLMQGVIDAVNGRPEPEPADAAA